MEEEKRRTLIKIRVLLNQLDIIYEKQDFVMLKKILKYLDNITNRLIGKAGYTRISLPKILSIILSET